MIDLFAFVDLETSGLYKSELPPEDPTQPHIVELGCILVDGSGKALSRIGLIIRPEGWGIEPAAEKVHGISEVTAHQAGVPLYLALATLKAMTEKASLIVGHGLFQFDGKVIASVLLRAGLEADWWTRSRRRWTCTMEAATPVLKLPGKYGDHKFPSLEEAVNLLTKRDTPWVSRHSAEGDAQATISVFFALRERGAL